MALTLTVFGLPFGISINISIDNLRRDGYYIDGYNNNEVYLRNVYEMNYSWDDGVVIYDLGGRTQSAVTLSVDLWLRLFALRQSIFANMQPIRIAGNAKIPQRRENSHLV